MENTYVKSLGIVIVLGILIIIVGIGMNLGKTREIPNPEPVSEPVTVTPEPAPLVHPDISVSNLSSGQVITLPFTVSGNVKGTWFFEGSFPVSMEDVAGNQLGFGLASSSEDWMTSNVIPFSVTLPVINYQGQGSIVFTKDNPSGLPEHDDSFTIPVTFQ